MSDTTAPIPYVPVTRRLWFVVLLTVLILTFPIALIFLVTGDVYKWKDGGYRPIKTGTRYIYAGLLVLWAVAVAAKAIISPTSIQQEWAKTADPDKPASASSNSNGAAVATTGPKVPHLCESPEAADMVKSAFANNDSVVAPVKLLDFGHAQETFFDAQNNVRRCQAEAVLNTGDTTIAYQLSFGPSGGELVQIEQGIRAEQQLISDRDDKIEAAKAATQSPQNAADAPSASTSNDTAPSVSAQSGSDAQTANPPQNKQADSYSAEYHSCMSSGEAANGVTSAMMACTTAELAAQDAKLNTTYRQLMATLDPEKQMALRAAQRSWIKFKDSKCDSENQSGGTMDQIGKPDCQMQMTAQRTAELQQMGSQ